MRGIQTVAISESARDLSGRDLAEKLASSMSQIHAWRVGMLTGPACGVPGEGRP